MKLLPALLVPVVVGAGVYLFQRGADAPAGSATVRAQTDDLERLDPGPEPVDRWNPERDTPAEPAYGGTLRIQIESLPAMLNWALLNAASARSALLELHAFLVKRDWETWKLEPELATGWEVADTLVAPDGTVHHGRVTESGAELRVEPLGAPPGADPLVFPVAGTRVEHGTVLTFHLRPDVRWHDGHPFDAEDVLFSWRIAQNPDVRCTWVRPYLGRIERAEALDKATVRFTFREQYFNSLALFADNLCILPRHLYDLRDPDHPRHDAAASDAACAREINENPCNTQWVGLGPYRLTSYSQQGFTAERFADFFDPENGGYVDRIEWLHIPDDETAFQALLDGGLDFTTRIGSDKYFGASMASDTFTARFCKGHYYLGNFNYVPWNMRRPILADLRVRKALAHAMDMDAFVANVAHGLAKLPTGPQCFFGPSYDQEVERLRYDPDRAAQLFTEAGWYDRDGDGVIDRDGRRFELEMIVQAGNAAATVFARIFQESLARVGVVLKITPLDSATYFQRINDRDFDCGIQSWSVDITENDPAQLWSSAAAGKGGSNHAGVVDPRVDDLIARGARELDSEKRWAMWRELHRYLYEEVQPYLYREASPRKFALAKAIRGVQFFKVTPGYSLRRWYYPAGTSGTRAERVPK